MGRKSNTDLRRQQIIDALLRELSVVGYARASTKSIATRAGLAPGLVHYHFRTKEEILLALVDGLIAEADRRFATVLTARVGALEKIKAFASSRVGLGPTADSHQVKAWVNILAEAMGQPKVRNRVSKWLSADHAQLLDLFKEAGSKAPAEHAATLLAMILGSFSLYSIRVRGVPQGYSERQCHQWIHSVVSG